MTTHGTKNAKQLQRGPKWPQMRKMTINVKCMCRHKTRDAKWVQREIATKVQNYFKAMQLSGRQTPKWLKRQEKWAEREEKQIYTFSRARNIFLCMCCHVVAVLIEHGGSWDGGQERILQLCVSGPALQYATNPIRGLSTPLCTHQHDNRLRSTKQ